MELIAQVFAQEIVMAAVKVIVLPDVIMHALNRAQVALLMLDQMDQREGAQVQIMLEVIAMAVV